MMSVECAVCRAPAELQEHFFFEGDPSNPSRRWRIVAPLYFNLEYRQGFCSAACSTEAEYSKRAVGHPK
jgi:hypothetical protein